MVAAQLGWVEVIKEPSPSGHIWDERSFAKGFPVVSSSPIQQERICSEAIGGVKCFLARISLVLPLAKGMQVITHQRRVISTSVALSVALPQPGPRSRMDSVLPACVVSTS